jgi:hypothetical protein
MQISLGTHGSFHPKHVFGGQAIFKNEIVNILVIFSWGLDS